MLVSRIGPQLRLDKLVRPKVSHSPISSIIEKLQVQRLTEEVRQLQIANQSASSPWHYLATLTPAMVGIAAILTFGLGWAKQRADSSRQRCLDRQQRESENVRDFDSKFAAAISNLGSDSLSLQASAASVLALFLNVRYRDFWHHIIKVTSANLRLSRDPVIRDLLIDVLGRAVRRSSISTPLKEDAVDVSGAHLQGINMTGASLPDILTANGTDFTLSRLDSCNLWKSDMREANLARASLRHANIGQSRFDRAELVHAVLDGARASSASLREVDGRYAMFKGASLQSVHFEGSDLRGARFDGANLADCYFYGAKLDRGALESIRRAENWRKAHFDPATIRELLEVGSG